MAKRKRQNVQRGDFYYDYESGCVFGYKPSDVSKKNHQFAQYDIPRVGFGSRLRQARKANGLTITMACKLTNTEPRIWRIWERVNHLREFRDGLHSSAAVEVAQLLGVSLEWLAYGEEGLAKMRKVLQRRKAALGLA